MPYKGAFYTKKVTFDGRTYYRRAKTEAEAKAKADQLLAELIADKHIKSTILVQDWADEWLELYKAGNINARYYADVKGLIKNWICPVRTEKKKESLRGMRVRDVTQHDLVKILNQMRDAGLSMSSIKKCRDVLSQIFEKAFVARHISTAIAHGLECPKPKKKTKTRRVLTAHEREIALQVAREHFGGPFVLLMLYTGMRCGEVAALDWDQVDLENRVLYVVQAVKSGGEIDEPKTKKGKRAVPISEPLYEVLSNLKHVPAKNNGGDAVVLSERGYRYSKTSYTKMWKKFKYQMNIVAGCKVNEAGGLIPPFPIADDLTLYSFRHTFATDMRDAGLSESQILAVMGHTKLTTTEGYLHATEANLALVRDAADALYKSKK